MRKLQKSYKNNGLTGKLKSIQEFSKKGQWFKKNWMSVGKQKHTGDRDPNKQENNIKY